MFKNGFNRFAKNDFENAFLRIQSHAYLKNSRHAQFNCLEHYQKIPNNKGSRRFASNRSSKMHENSKKNQSHKGKSSKKPKKIDEKNVPAHKKFYVKFYMKFLCAGFLFLNYRCAMYISRYICFILSEKFFQLVLASVLICEM